MAAAFLSPAPAMAACIIALVALDPAAAALNRCTGADGSVTFTERACESGQEQSEMKGPAPARPAEPAVTRTRPAPGQSPWVRNSERCTSLEKSIAEWSAKMRAQTVNPPPYDEYPLQQRNYYEERFHKECIDERAWQDAQKQQAAERETAECATRRRAITWSRESIARNPNNYELVARERENVLRNELYLRERCR